MIDFDSIPVSSHTRVKELMILLQEVISGEGFVEPELQVTWHNQLVALVGKENAQNWIARLSFIFSLTRDRTLLGAIADYQNAPECVYEDNFDGTKRFCAISLAERIKLLYEIGVLAGELKASEKFDSRTRVTQRQQEACDRVIQWVEKKLGLEMQPINVYLPFIWDCQRYEYLREKSLYQIGVRAELSINPVLEQFSESDHETVITWVRQTFDIDLSKQLEPSNTGLTESTEPSNLVDLDLSNIDLPKSSESSNLAESEIPSIKKLARKKAMTELVAFAGGILLVLFPIALLVTDLARQLSLSEFEWKKLATEKDTLTHEDVRPTPVPLEPVPQLKTSPACP